MFEWECPRMMAIGVPYDLYWSGEPSAIRYFIEAHEIAQERSNDEMDTAAWLVGAYVHEAVGVVLSNAFKKGGHAKYAKEPYTRTAKRAAEERDAEIMRAANQMRALVSVYNRRRRARDGRAATDSNEGS